MLPQLHRIPPVHSVTTPSLSTLTLHLSFSVCSLSTSLANVLPSPSLLPISLGPLTLPFPFPSLHHATCPPSPVPPYTISLLPLYSPSTSHASSPKFSSPHPTLPLCINSLFVGLACDLLHAHTWSFLPCTHAHTHTPTYMCSCPLFDSVYLCLY